MAESFLFSIAESLVAKLASQAFEEASQLVGVYDQLKEFKETLSLVKAVLLDAQQKQEHNNELKEWLRQLKHVFYDAEDVLDEFECETLRKQMVKTYATTKDKVGYFFSSSNPLVFRYRMAKKIKEISKRLDKVAADRQKFGLQIIDAERLVVHTRELTHSRVANSDVIGRKQDREKIIEILMHQNPNDNNTSLPVIPIVGMGGLGKTTLAKFVFNDERIRECFPLRMWVCVSVEFDLKQLVSKIIKSADNLASSDASRLQNNLNMLDLEQLQIQLTNKLASKKFLLVLDDVWNDNRVKWVELMNLINVGVPESKILVTTRNTSIASMMGTVPSHILQGLSLDDSLSLFFKWAFREGEEKNYPHLINIGREIVKKCGGVPLALRTLGSLLYSKFESNEWEYVRENEIWNLSPEKDDILPALKLSYDLMPSYLRQCFAFFSLYPKDYQFFKYDIMLFWRALGLLESPKKNMKLEEVAVQYLDELLSRSFIQESDQDIGIPLAVKIHDLMHDLAVFVAKDEFRYIDSHSQNIPENVRHVSFAENSLLGNLLATSSVAMRTILFPNGLAGANGEALLNTCLSKFKYLRVLELNRSTCETLPNSIGKLKHLRYFSIMNNHNIKRLPDSICKLQNLQVLRLIRCMEFEALPKGLGKLVSLRVLEITTKQSTLFCNEIASLRSLEHLSIGSSQNLESIFGGVKFPALTNLSVSYCGNLKTLTLEVKSFPKLIALEIIECGNLDLELWKDYHQEQSPWLKLYYVCFSSLPQLVTLPQWVQETVNSLEILVISYCDNLESLPEWLSTLTNLKFLNITNCPKLHSLPDSIHQLTALEKLVIEDCPELCRKYQPHVGEFWSKISHIDDVSIEMESEED
ncbi:hypothetical protein Fmac_029545 [Flemingia macrophylla]|uniref:Uncharacterized protein n=1 Tax=Flemingia macrophylla TaxID=520843 RepID=A0ABD1LAN5_9FABA